MMVALPYVRDDVPLVCVRKGGCACLHARYDLRPNESRWGGWNAIAPLSRSGNMNLLAGLMQNDDMARANGVKMRPVAWPGWRVPGIPRHGRRGRV